MDSRLRGNDDEKMMQYLFGEIDLNGFTAVNRGGNWNNGTNAGLGTANLNNGPGKHIVNLVCGSKI